jgi:hypothetical protein
VVGNTRPTGTPGVGVQGELLVIRADGMMAWNDEFEGQLGAFNTTFDGVTVDTDQRAYCAGSMAAAPNNTDLAAVVVRYKADAGVDAIWSWNGGAGGDNAFGPLVRDTVIVAGGQATTPAGSQAVVERLKP